MLGRTSRGVRRPRPALERDSLVFTDLPTTPRRLCNVRCRARLSAALFARPGRSLSRGGGLPACAVGGRLRPLSQAVRRVAGAHCDATRRYLRAQSYSRPRNSALWSAPVTSEQGLPHSTLCPCCDGRRPRRAVQQRFAWRVLDRGSAGGAAGGGTSKRTKKAGWASAGKTGKEKARRPNADGSRPQSARRLMSGMQSCFLKPYRMHACDRWAQCRRRRSRRTPARARSFS